MGISHVDLALGLGVCGWPFFWIIPRLARNSRCMRVPFRMVRAKATKKRCAASNGGYPTSCTDNCAGMQTGWRRAREDTRGRLYCPARPAETPHADSSDKSLPGPTISHHIDEHTRPLLTQRGAVYAPW